MQTLTAALIELVLNGQIDSEVAASAAPNRHDFTIALGRAVKENEVAQARRSRTPRRTARCDRDAETVGLAHEHRLT